MRGKSREALSVKTDHFSQALSGSQKHCKKIIMLCYRL